MCKRCNNSSCRGGCGTTRQIVNNNNSIGRDGESAYDIAVRNGFEGTEEEWLESLKGVVGAKNGVSIDTSDDKLKLGGELTEDTFVGSYLGSKIMLGLSPSTKTASITLNGDTYTASLGIGLTANTEFPNQRVPQLLRNQGFNATGIEILQQGALVTDGILGKGLGDAADYSANKTEFSYVTKQMLDAATGSGITASRGLSKIGSDIKLGGTYLDEEYITVRPFTNIGGKLNLDNRNSELSVFDTPEQNNYSSIGITDMGLRMRYRRPDFKEQSILIQETSLGDGSREMVVVDSINEKGLGDKADYSASKTQFSYVTKQMLDDATSGGGGGVTAINGLNKSGSDIKLGGPLTETTEIGGDAVTINLNPIGAASMSTKTGAGPTMSINGMILDGDSIAFVRLKPVGAIKEALEINTDNGITFVDDANNRGAGDRADYSLNKTDYSYVTKKMLYDAIAGGTIGSWTTIPGKSSVLQYEGIDIEYKLDFALVSSKAMVHLVGQFIIQDTYAANSILVGTLPANARPKSVWKSAVFCDNVLCYLTIDTTGIITITTVSGNLPVYAGNNDTNVFNIDIFFKPVIASDYPFVIASVTDVPADPQVGGTNQYKFRVNIGSAISEDLTLNFSCNYDAVGGGSSTYSGSITLPAGETSFTTPDFEITDASPASSIDGLTINSGSPVSGSTVTDMSTGTPRTLIY